MVGVRRGWKVGGGWEEVRRGFKMSARGVRKARGLRRDWNL